MSDRMSVDDVTYHGIRRVRGDCTILIEDRNARRLGVVQHLPRHSPTGMEWGYGGSGPADTARSLLLTAIGGRDACCPTCQGRRDVVYDFTRDRETPYDPAAGHDPGARARCIDCDDGYRHVPYQRFKWDHVAKWGQEWRMRRSEILGWLRDVGWTLPYPDDPTLNALRDFHKPATAPTPPQLPNSASHPSL